jgi:hypothetical protein
MKLTSVQVAVLLGCTIQCASGQYLVCEPRSYTLSLAGLAPSAEPLTVADASNAHVTFKYSGTEDTNGKPVPDSLKPFVLSPASGTTPAASFGDMLRNSEEAEPGRNWDGQPIIQFCCIRPHSHYARFHPTFFFCNQ